VRTHRKRRRKFFSIETGHACERKQLFMDGHLNGENLFREYLGCCEGAKENDQDRRPRWVGSKEKLEETIRAEKTVQNMRKEEELYDNGGFSPSEEKKGSRRKRRGGRAVDQPHLTAVP